MIDTDHQETHKGRDSSELPKKIVLVLGALLTLMIVRVYFVSPLDSGVTRLGCQNHATYLNDVGQSETVNLDERNSEEVIRLVEEGSTWQVRRHIRSNKLGLVDRDSAACVMTVFGEDEEITIPMSLAAHGTFYYVGKVLGIILQLGMVSAFIRWYHYRFMS